MLAGGPELGRFSAYFPWPGLAVILVTLERGCAIIARTGPQPGLTTTLVKIIQTLVPPRGGLPAPPDPPGPRASSPGGNNRESALTGPPARPGRAGRPGSAHSPLFPPGPEARGPGGPGRPVAPPRWYKCLNNKF